MKRPSNKRIDEVQNIRSEAVELRRLYEIKCRRSGYANRAIWLSMEIISLDKRIAACDRWLNIYASHKRELTQVSNQTQNE